jgi:glycosyltransferase involved in cell wall biosynthesis
MRVLYLARYVPALTETFVADELRGVAEAGIRVEVASLGTRADSAIAEPVPGVPVFEVPRARLARLRAPRSPSARQLAAWQRPKDAARLPALAAHARTFDGVHVHFAGEAAELAWALHRDHGLPYTVTVHAVDLFKPRPSFDAVLAGAARVFTVAEHHRLLLADRGHAAELVRCGPRLADFASLPAPPDGPLRALFVGRDVPKKGLDLLLDAWAAAPSDARLEVISDAVRPSWPARVRATGLQPRPAVRAALARANAVVLPCRRAPDGDQDGVPVVLMEALAARRPVVTCPISGVPELVDEAVGWLAAPDDTDALAQAILAATDGSGRRDRGDRGPARLRGRGFTHSEQVRRVIHAWTSCFRPVACGSPESRT